MSKYKYIDSEFYCPCCGNKVFNLYRKPGFQHGKHHRKKLYCYHCKETLNCIECRNQEEVDEFKENYANGIYENEWKESIEYIKQEKVYK